MTKPRYPQGCPAGSKVPVEAPSPSDYAWSVNFNNGNVNNNDQHNSGFVRPVRRVSSGECQGAPQASLRELYKANTAARRGKKPSHNLVQFQLHKMAGLIDIEQQIAAGIWQPRGTTCFIAQRPKAREIHAPEFVDRVVHHWLVPQLEAIFDPGFIHDSFANRAGKGTHKAVERLQGFVRQVHSGQGFRRADPPRSSGAQTELAAGVRRPGKRAIDAGRGGWFLQMDIHNFFNSIHRPTLWGRLKPRLQRAGASEQVLQITHTLIRRSPLEQGVRYRATQAERDQVPAHKRLANAAPGCGLPIGNLSSQFFANVYLDALDQFVKHVLKVPRYLRYVDDFVIVHHDRAQLVEWQREIEQFLHRELRLRLKDGTQLAPLTHGIDFLGYLVHPTHTLVRPRVIQHAREALHAWQQAHVTPGAITATPEQLREVRSVWASYGGHFRHAHSYRLRQDFHRRHPWLHSAAEVPRRFHPKAEGRPITINFGAQRV